MAAQVGLADLVAEVEALSARVARLERERRKGVHHHDMTDVQRRVLDAVTVATGVSRNELLAKGRGPRPTAEARFVLYSALSDYGNMSASQIGRFVGRTPEAVTRGIAKIVCGCETLNDEGVCPCGPDAISNRRYPWVDATYRLFYGDDALGVDEPDDDDRGDGLGDEQVEQALPTVSMSRSDLGIGDPFAGHASDAASDEDVWLAAEDDDG